ncbi:tail protein [Pseudomonas mandelii PD30]|uniref:Tail protein n=1 Tax=Pseudomonas mandelii PD30 TaxID=1419583 RepID=A0A059KU22_9PSED|nr:phage tail protein [Pseudomonas mandelii]KDD65578.1 tail protein [Pseudomonas mandelii PD30]
MIDANSQFFAILTNVGMAKQANAAALGLPWKFTDMGVGDANNTDPIPSAAQTQLINEWRRRPLNQVRVDPVNPAVIIAEQIIPADEGGRWIREIALYDADGDMVAVANCAPSFKPVLSQGSGRTQVVRMNFVVSSTGNITLKIDPAVVLATREYVDSKILEELNKLDSKQSVLVATTANIALAGLQVIDGVSVPAGARVLVKNQTVAKDNGIWIAAAPVWTRAPDADTNAEVTSALLVSVEQGATQADTRWQLVTDGVIVLGTTALTFQNITQGFAPINSPALLGAPTALTPPQFDSSLRLVNTAFAKRMGVEYSGFAPLTASTALGASSIGGIVAAASATAINITLPPTAGVPEGATVEVVNAGAGAATVLAAGLDVLASQVAGVIPVVLGMGDNAKFVKVSGTWRLRGGSMALKYAAIMSGPNWLTQPQFSYGKAFATTEFVKQMGVEWSNFNSVNVSTALNSGSVGGIISAASVTPISLTVPPTGPVAQSGTILVLNAGGGAVTLLASGADLLTSPSGITVPIVLGQGDFALLTRVSNEWRLIGGSVALKHAAAFGSSLAVNGYQKLPGGLQECRGTFIASATPGAPVAVSFPQGFAAVQEVVITPVNASTTTSSAWHDSASASGFNGRCNIASAVCHYIAKGTAV